MPMRTRPLAPTVVRSVESDARRAQVPRYLVERNFPAGVPLPAGAAGAEAARDVIEHNELEGVTWLHSYVSEDKTKTFCIYDGPGPEAIRRTASANGLPVDGMTEVRVFDPYLYF